MTIEQIRTDAEFITYIKDNFGLPFAIESAKHNIMREHWTINHTTDEAERNLAVERLAFWDGVFNDLLR